MTQKDLAKRLEVSQPVVSNYENEFVEGVISGPINEGPNGSVIQLADKQEPTADDIAKNLPTRRHHPTCSCLVCKP